MNINKLLTSKDKNRQEKINEFYDEYIKKNKTKEQKLHGVVHTPMEVVEFIINSVDDIAIKEFGVSIFDKDVKIFDPFTGTGTFITQLLDQLFISNPDNMEYKYKNDIYANEIMQVGYDIAKQNIQNTYENHTGISEEFKGIKNIDTFKEAI